MARRMFAAGATALFLASAAATVAGASMPAMAWSRMCGQSWPAAAGSFLAMWLAMTAAMMLPSLAPRLWGYRMAVAQAGEAQPLRSAALAGAAYFVLWGVLGLAVYLPGAMLAAAQLRLPALARAIPFAAGATVAAAGLLQFTAWKARLLAACRQASGCSDPFSPGTASAWHDGLRLGRHCIGCCIGPMAALLALGVMAPGPMVAVTVAITLERLAPAGAAIARITGAIALATGIAMLVRAGGIA